MNKFLKFYLLGVILSILVITSANRSYLYKSDVGSCPIILLVGSWATIIAVGLVSGVVGIGYLVEAVDWESNKVVRSTAYVYNYANANDKKEQRK